MMLNESLNDFLDNPDGISNDVRSSSDAHPDAYVDPSTVFREGGDKRGITSLMSSGRSSGGVVIPRNDGGGIPRGLKVHNASIVNIDPHLTSTGKASTVDLSKVSKEQMDQAIKEAYSQTTDQDMRAALVYRILDDLTNNDKIEKTKTMEVLETVPVTEQFNTNQPTTEVKVVKAKPSKTKLQVSNPIPTNTMKDFQINKADHESSILANYFNKAKKTKPTTQYDTSATKAPDKTVTYEVEGFGQLSSAYHDIVRDGINLILVYDCGYTAGQKFFPQSDPDKNFIVDVHDMESIFKVISPDIKFTLNYDNKKLEICVLFIVAEVPRDEE